ncbi:MAG: hypothetical protein R2822_28890 [Spirosomataceae bacterium]
MYSATIRLTLLGFIGITTFLIPCLAIYYLFRAGYISSLHLDGLADRRLPYFVTTLLYSFATYFFSIQLASLAEIAPEIGVILASVTISIALVGLISLRWKISAHATGMGGFLGALFGIVVKFNENHLIYPLLIGIVLGGMLLSARLQLNAHTPAQVGAGTALGILISIITVWLFV